MTLAGGNKLSRTYATLLEALNRHRGKGLQKIVVERVAVQAGGQAIVGAVSSQGGGVPRKIERPNQRARSSIRQHQHDA